MIDSFIEWYSYANMGIAISGVLFVFFTLVVAYRFVAAFRNYIYTGKFGDYERSAFGQTMEANGIAAVVKYGLTGYHPPMILFDALFFTLIALLAQPLWGVFIIGGLLVTLAMVMRKRIAHKQEFVGNLRGDHLDG